MTIHILRRAKLGAGSAKGLSQVFTQHGEETCIHCTGSRSIVEPEEASSRTCGDMVIRWGMTGNIPPELRGIPLMNTPTAIHQVNDKMSFAKTVAQNINSQLPVITSEDSGTIADLSEEMKRLTSSTSRWILRSKVHAQGRRLFKTNSNRLAWLLKKYRRSVESGWYARPYVAKQAEYRVYVVCGRVAAVAQKTPGNPNKIAWNVARGGMFRNLRWDSWPLDVCQVAVDCFNVSDLHFGGVDVMVEEGTGTPYFIEINSAPSLPLSESGRHTYRHQSMAKAFMYHQVNGLDRLELDSENQGWRHYIHPGVWSREARHQERAAA